ncbi:TIGR02391 family protein [Halorubrum sp. AS12]|uniref:TIGR02391 family protein n=1 Tax=Halorubrum sp. AS12 TaxID=3409687 RepID=UPI003DA707BD
MESNMTVLVMLCIVTRRRGKPNLYRRGIVFKADSWQPEYMEASRTFEHEEYADGRFKSHEKTEVLLQVETDHAELDISHEVRESEDRDVTVASISVEKIPVRDIRFICDRLAEWCGGLQEDSLEFDTGFLTGTYTRDGQQWPIERLQFVVTPEGITIKASGSRNDTAPQTVGEVHVPPQGRTNDDADNYPRHIHSFKSFLQTVLSCTQNYTDDDWPRLDGAGEFTGPLDSRLADMSLERYHAGDHVQAIAAGAQELERILKQRFPEYEDDSAANLMPKVFKPDAGSDSFLKFSTDSDQQQGIQFLYQGLVAAYRNPLTHTHPSADSEEFPNEISRRQARDVLYYLDLLYLLLEEGEPVSSEE